jgi:hypothetical protein
MLVLLFLISLSFANSNYVDKDSAKNYVGKDIVICDLVQHVVVPNHNNSPYILYFEEYSGAFSKNKYSFNGIIWNNSVPVLEMNPKSELSGRFVCISGTVSMYDGVAQIIISKPSQIYIVDVKSLGVK